jgi:hypothetical protein
MQGSGPTYEELARALEELEARYARLEKAHSELLNELQSRLAKLEETMESGLPRARSRQDPADPAGT